LLGETSLLDGSEPLDELSGPILNMVAMLRESKVKRRVVVLNGSENCECAERNVVVMMSSRSRLIIERFTGKCAKSGAA
jgi:hypothetical protein